MLPALAASLLMLVMVLLAFGKRPEHVETVIVNMSRKECLMRDLDGWQRCTEFSRFSDYRARNRDDN